ncbi:hypothetical protein [Streptomyces acidicola]|uniref:Uncharacterized protein n=1 Tax=Streptomyces acidicola TaxID=2596892 RepID=A0A5N8WIL9_9ACTN|nr:hypothetical protein [Streptomyces acidicola]MPY47079.1 hypothetical protein [Streptomyces acidicola]MPY47218.1 hypothetical protein [Streptomyces acidicola]
MTAAHRQPPHHDTLTCYTDYKCRLPECVDRYNAWSRDRERAIADGTWQPLLDAEPIRQHLLTLHAAGITIHRVAQLTGLTYRSVRSFTQHDYGNAAPRRHRATREVAAKILAINLDEHTPAVVSPIGTQRRFRALVAIGWPTVHTAIRAGLHPSNRNSMLRYPTIQARTAQRVAAVYDEMRHESPAKHGISATSIKRAKLQAQRERWAPPSYWDEVGGIDDPDFEPQYGITRREIVAQDAHWLMQSGLDRAAAAERLGVSKSYVEHALAAHPDTERELAA